MPTFGWPRDRLLLFIAGGEEAYQARPMLSHHYCPVVSPLTMDVESLEAVMYLTEKGFPVYMGRYC